MGIALPDLTGWPPWAQTVFYAVLAVTVGGGVGALWLGVIKGRTAKPETTGAGSATVVAVTVDSAALNRLTAAVEAGNMTLIEANLINREARTAVASVAKASREQAKVSADASDALSRALQDVARSLKELENEVRMSQRK